MFYVKVDGLSVWYETCWAKRGCVMAWQFFFPHNPLLISVIWLIDFFIVKFYRNSGMYTKWSFTYITVYLFLNIKNVREFPCMYIFSYSLSFKNIAVLSLLRFYNKDCIISYIWFRHIHYVTDLPFQPCLSFVSTCLYNQIIL